ncbi:hypothetical protein D9Y79_02080 [Campylobacter coli]|nr:hypothetical protein [Campylobacter coli]EIA56867.1 hypothetical protein cco115_02562 [Campylobacter coli 2692]APA55963.1 hypothetical protein BLD39_04455 [Campylobacter coli]AUG27145.1 hypothetical protein CXQ83_04980 [Campylobacter coli]EAC1777306.1 hypothetical protein [Campylobacter coli]EAC2042992.1 hypothetical protein [Campylobacter coli]
MSHIFWVIICTSGALLLFLSLIAYLILSDNKKKNKNKKQKNTENTAKARKFDNDLNKMIAAASDLKYSDRDLKELVKLFVQTHKLGSKTSKELDEKTKNKLEFVSALAANPKASPQTVSFLNQELKKISASYKKEIDAYEQMGLAKRKIKEEK